MPSLAKKLREYIKLQSNLEKKRKKWKKAKQIERKRLRDAKKAKIASTTEVGKHDLKKLSIKLDKVDVAKELEKLKNLSKSDANNNVRKQDSEEELGSRKARPDDLTEPDPLLKSVPSDEVDSILAEDRKKPASSSKVSEVNVTTSDGSITVAKFAIVKRDKKPRDFPCPAKPCAKICHLIKELNDHIQKIHPDFKFKCSQCPKLYSTYNARYKHEHSHFELPYVCHFCRKRFLFPGLRDRHEGQHTGKNLFPCTWRSCKIKLSSKDALRQHVDTHTEVRYPCTHKDCAQTFNTVSILKQHEKGTHGDGYISLCGASFDWSDSRNDHQNDCTECSERKEEKFHLPKSLKPLKQWKKSIQKDQALPFLWQKEPTVYSSDVAYLFYSFRCVFPFV